MIHLSLIEIRKYLLDIAKEFDCICRQEQIPYYMLGGTMLGAIRHKGFIPWDDDMDFGVPIRYFPLLTEALSKKLTPPFRCCTHENSSSVFFPYIKIEHEGTVLDDPQIPLPTNEKIGLNIDVFPLIECDLNDKDIHIIWLLSKLYGTIYTDSRHHGKLVNTMKLFLRKITPWDNNEIYKEIRERMLNLKSGEYLGNIMGRWKEKEIIPINWYGENIQYKFEDTYFFGIKEYDSYLKRLYGDYMTLPPKERQISDHATNVYLK